MKYQTKIKIVAAVVLAVAATGYISAKPDRQITRFEKLQTVSTKDGVEVNVRMFGFYYDGVVHYPSEDNIANIFGAENLVAFDLTKMRQLRHQLNEPAEMHIDSFSYSCDPKCP